MIAWMQRSPVLKPGDSIVCSLSTPTFQSHLCLLSFHEAFIHTTSAIAEKVNGHIGVAYFAQALGDDTAHFILDQTRKLRSLDLDTRNFVMVANAQLVETELAQQFFRLVDHLQRGDINLTPVGDAR